MHLQSFHVSSLAIIGWVLTMKESTMVTVSAVIPTRGRPELLRRAVRSALAQTLREIEVVVVIDGEDPATQVVLQELAQQDGRLRVLALPCQRGWIGRT